MLAGARVRPWCLSGREQPSIGFLGPGAHRGVQLDCAPEVTDKNRARRLLPAGQPLVLPEPGQELGIPSE